MNHTVEKISSNQVKISFTVAAEQFDEAMQKAYFKMRGRINVPGFRKGKAPKALIEQMYGEGVFYDDAFESLFPTIYQEVIEKEELHPVDRPNVDISQIGSGQELVFTVEVYVKPDVTLGEYKNLTVHAHQHPVTKEQIDARIKQDQEKNARIIDVEDRAVKNGDIVNLDYAGSVEEVPFEGGTAQGQTLEIGSGQFIPGFEEQMIGMNLQEEKDIKVTFPTEYHAEELAGKEAVFHVKVNGIQVKELPALDDEFAMDVSEFETLEAYQKDLEKHMQEEEEKRFDIEVENALIGKAVENAAVEIPTAMVEDQIDFMIRDMTLRMAYQGLKMEDYLKYTGQTEEQMREMYQGEAQNRVKTELVLEAIKKEENVTPSQEAIDAQIAQQAERSGETVEKFEERFNDRQKEMMAESAAIQMVVDLMKSTATIDQNPPQEEEEQKEKPKKKKKEEEKKDIEQKEQK
ncbi:MAG: trigger factor [Clostridiales bacterium]|nr:trigger factor [Clostridiales bacterium]